MEQLSFSPPLKKFIVPKLKCAMLSFVNLGELYEIFSKKFTIVKPIKTAVIHPVDDVSLLGAIESAQAKIITPILIGPRRQNPCSSQKTSNLI